VWGEVQIIEEDTPLRTPRDAFAQLAAFNTFNLHASSSVISLDRSPMKQDHIDSELECDTPSPNSKISNPSSMDSRLCHLGSQSSDSMKSSSDEDEDLMPKQFWKRKQHSVRESGASSHSDKKTNMRNDNDLCLTPLQSSPIAKTRDAKRRRQYHAYSKQASQAPLSFWPRWVYEMYDSYTLARSAAGIEIQSHQPMFYICSFVKLFSCYSKISASCLRSHWNVWSIV
jgi:cereblon